MKTALLGGLVTATCLWFGSIGTNKELDRPIIILLDQ